MKASHSSKQASLTSRCYMQSFNFLASKLWLYIKDKRTDIQTTFCGLKNIYFNLTKCDFWDSFSNAKMVLSSIADF